MTRLIEAEALIGISPRTAKPYSPRTLAERWGCSAEKVRLMFEARELDGFRLGKLIRIPAAEVERYECQTTASPDIAENGRSPGATDSDGFESRLERLTGDWPRPALVKSGSGSPPRQVNG